MIICLCSENFRADGCRRHVGSSGKTKVRPFVFCHVFFFRSRPLTPLGSGPWVDYPHLDWIRNLVICLPCHVNVPPCSQNFPARASRRHVPVKEKRGHVPYDCGPGCWLDNPDLPLSLSLLLISLPRGLDAYPLPRSLFLTPALSLSDSLYSPSMYFYICT